MTVTKTLRFTILARDGFECVYCHAKDKPLEVDHVRPKALGGTDSPENLVAACADCNGGKSAAHLAEMDSIPRPIMMQNAVLIEQLRTENAKLQAELDRYAADCFPRHVVEKLRRQNASLRERARTAEQQLNALVQVLRDAGRARIAEKQLSSVVRAFSSQERSDAK